MSDPIHCGPITGEICLAPTGVLYSEQQKNPLDFQGVHFCKLASTYSSVPISTVPSALEGLTSVFGMGTGVAPPLLTPAKIDQVKFSHNSSISSSLKWETASYSFQFLDLEP